jgi:hypothetical protein
MFQFIGIERSCSIKTFIEISVDSPEIILSIHISLNLLLSTYFSKIFQCSKTLPLLIYFSVLRYDGLQRKTGGRQKCSSELK